MSSTGFVNGSTLTDAGWFNDVDTVTYKRLTSVSGTNTIVGTGPVSMTVYATGQEFAFIPAATNTGATTLNITPSGASALGAKNIFWNGAALVGGELVINVPCLVMYDGTQFNLMTQGTARIKGTTTNDSAASGNVGEYVESVVSGVSFASSTQWKDLTSISLTAGDWDISMDFIADFSGVTATEMSWGISQTTGNSTTGLVLGSNRFQIIRAALGASESGAVSGYRQSLSGTTTIYAKIESTYSASVGVVYGRLSARRSR